MDHPDKAEHLFLSSLLLQCFCFELELTTQIKLSLPVHCLGYGGGKDRKGTAKEGGKKGKTGTRERAGDSVVILGVSKILIH